VIYDSKAVTSDDFSWLVTCRWPLLSDGWEHVPNRDGKPHIENGVVYLRRPLKGASTAPYTLS
jgi:hypothetical protein